MNSMFNPDNLPDIAAQAASETNHTLQWVGMESIAIPCSFATSPDNQQPVSVKADLYVSLDKADAKGIHMSRLYRGLNQYNGQVINKQFTDQLLSQMVESQNGLSNSARINLSFDLLLRKNALLSDESGFQSYPVCITAERIRGENRYQIGFTLTYSSTCPCSAALSRQLLAETVAQRFAADNIDKTELLSWLQSVEGTVATPHSQRSLADISIRLADAEWPDLTSLILQLEDAIGTPVQTAVKRQDEQAFARLNATNLMFCEDAGRRLKARLERVPEITNYHFKVSHQESLHAHDAVVIDSKYPSLNPL